MDKIFKFIYASCLIFVMTACQSQDTLSEGLLNDTTNDSKVLIVYFSLHGNDENDANTDASTSASVVTDGNQHVGTTEYVANLIQEQTGGEIYFIEAAEKYPEDFQEVIDRNHQEQNQEFLPEIRGEEIQIEDYDTIFIGYPVWAASIPQGIHSFLEKYDLSQKTIIPFCTHDGYGSGDSYEQIKELSHSTKVLDGLAIDSHKVLTSDFQVEEWIVALHLNQSSQICIQIGDDQLDGQLNNSMEAQQLKAMMPLTISMVHYGHREFYGPISEAIEVEGNGQLSFENGDITYCPTNQTVAIFYNQSDHPDLTMEVYVIGKVTSDLSIFHDLSSQENITLTLYEEE